MNAQVADTRIAICIDDSDQYNETEHIVHKIRKTNINSFWPKNATKYALSPIHNNDPRPNIIPLV